MPRSTLQLRRPSLCPKCFGSDIRLILYGRPTGEAVEMIAHGDACLGQCAIGRWLPDWRCHQCGYEWFDPRDPAKQKLERLVEWLLHSSDDHTSLAA